MSERPSDVAEQGPPRLGMAALWLAVSVVVLLVGGVLPMPGLDHDALASALGGSGQVRALAIVGLSIGALIAVRVGASVLGARSARGRALAFLVYLTLTALQALGLALWLESLAFPFEVVLEPGWRFRMIATVSWLAGAAVLYWLADRIDATRAATGALALGFVASLVALVPAALDAGMMLDIDRLASLAPLAPAVLVLVAAVLVSVRAPATWPVPIARDLELRSPLDVLAAPLAIYALTSDGLGTWPPVRLGLTLAGTLGVAALLVVRTKPGGPRRLWPAALGALTVIAVAAPFTVGLTTSGALESLLAPGPLAGQASFEVTLAAVDRFAEGEARAMARVIEMGGARVDVVSASPERITLHVRDAIGSEEVLEALRPRSVALHLVAPIPEHVRPPAGARWAHTSSRSVEGSCETLRDFAPSVPCRAAVSTGDDECTLYCLEEEAVVSAADITDAAVNVDPYTGQPFVTATLRNAERFETITRDNVGRQLAIVVNDDVTSAPVIQSAIPGGRVQITLGALRSHDELLREANVLVMALRSDTPITSAWTLESIR